jgi:hypothetical protein
VESRAPTGPTAAAAFVATTAGALAIVALDAVMASGRPPGGIGLAGALLFAVFGVAFALLTAGPIVAIDAAVTRRIAPGARASWALVGLAEGTAIVGLAVVAQDPRTVDGNARVGLLLLAALGMAIARVGVVATAPQLWARARPSVCVAIAIVGVVQAERLRYNGQEWARIACDLAAIVAIARVVAPRLEPSRARGIARPLAVGAALVVLASGWVLGHDGARALLHQRSAHVRSWLRIAQVPADRDGDGATTVFGGTDCAPDDPAIHPAASEVPGNGKDDNCRDGDPTASAEAPTQPVARASARGHDVLILSIDALRADATEHLGELRDALGPHVAFTRAQSPAPATKESLSATMRGVPARALHFERHPDVRGSLLWRDPHASLGHALRDADYRTVTVPSNNMFDPRIGVTSGFESLWLANADASGIANDRPPHTQDHVHSSALFELGLDVAARTRGPLCLWLHVMDTHAPYHHPDGTSGPRSREGYERSLGEVSTAAAAFVRDFAAQRGRAPVVVVLGDHGEEFGEHGGIQHASSAYIEQVAVALLVAAPGVAAQRIDVPVSTTGVPRTVLELVGVAVPSSMTEPSLLGTPNPNRLVVAESATSEGLHAVGYTRGSTRLVVDPVHDTAVLFDLASDPTEQHDRSGEDPALLAEMRALASAWNESH